MLSPSLMHMLEAYYVVSLIETFLCWRHGYVVSLIDANAGGMGMLSSSLMHMVEAWVCCLPH